MRKTLCNSNTPVFPMLNIKFVLFLGPQLVNKDCTNKNDGDIDPLSLGLDIHDRDYYTKHYNTFLRQHQALQVKYDNLVLAHRKLKQSTIGKNIWYALKI